MDLDMLVTTHPLVVHLLSLGWTLNTVRTDSVSLDSPRQPHILTLRFWPGEPYTVTSAELVRYTDSVRRTGGRPARLDFTGVVLCVLAWVSEHDSDTVGRFDYVEKYTDEMHADAARIVADSLAILEAERTPTLDEPVTLDELDEISDELDAAHDWTASRCVVCGDPIDYCQGHGPMGDPDGYEILEAHESGHHERCDATACDERQEWIEAQADADERPFSDLSENEKQDRLDADEPASTSERPTVARLVSGVVYADTDTSTATREVHSFKNVPYLDALDWFKLKCYAVGAYGLDEIVGMLDAGTGDVLDDTRVRVELAWSVNPDYQG